MQGVGPLFRTLAERIEALLADTGYDADAIRDTLANADVEAVIPAKSNRRTPIPHEREKNCWRDLIERLFDKLKDLKGRNLLRQDRGLPPRFRGARLSQAVAVLCPQRLATTHRSGRGRRGRETLYYTGLKQRLTTSFSSN